MSTSSKWWSVAAVVAAVGMASCAEPVSAPVVPATVTAPSALLTGTPSLVSCPGGDGGATSGLVGVLGGTLQLGSTRVSIPAGAVLSPTIFTLTTPASEHMEIRVTALNALHYVFRRPVTITIDYGRCAAEATDAAPLSVWYIDTGTKALLENMGGINDPVARTITFTTDHFSGYAIAN